MRGNGVGAQLARGASLALGIRIVSLAASYVMYLVLAHHMSKDAYGQFSFAFSLATFMAVVALLGQQLLVLRFIPAYLQEPNRPLLRGLIRDSRRAVAAGAFVCGLLMLLAAAIWDQIGHSDVGYLVSAAALMVTFVAAHHQAHVMRGFGEIAIALIPFDIAWRLLVIGGVFWIGRYGVGLSASLALGLAAMTLLLVVAVQTQLHRPSRPGVEFRSALATDHSRWLRESLGLWGATTAEAAVPNLSIVLLGLALAPEHTGPFFAAAKTATLLNLPLAAGNLIGAPLIARYYHGGEKLKVQQISHYLVIAVTLPVLVGFVLIAVFGTRILGYFGEGFATAQWALVIIAFGNLINALSGPTNTLMNMTGHHRQYLSILCISQLVSLLILPFAAWYFGMVGAAVAMAIGNVWWNLWVWMWARKHIKVDPTVFGVIQWLVSRLARPVLVEDRA